MAGNKLICPKSMGGGSMTQVGKNIKTNRTELQMTQQDLADKMSVTRQTISGWEQGVSQTKRY